MQLFVLLGIPIVLSALYWFWLRKPAAPIADFTFLPNWKSILSEKVAFYRTLSEEEKKRYEDEILEFLNTTRITAGGEIEMTDELLLLTASSAVMPVFYIKGWPYHSLQEVVLVPDYVRDPGDVKNMERTNITGMVFRKSTSHTVFFSVSALIDGFKNSRDSKHVGIHEFAHLVDYADGEIDGVPAVFLPKELIPEWKALMEIEMENIAAGKTKINPYGATAEEEFFAVMSEAYFENPRRLQNHHKRVYELLKKVYK